MQIEITKQEVELINKIDEVYAKYKKAIGEHVKTCPICNGTAALEYGFTTCYYTNDEQK